MASSKGAFNACIYRHIDSQIYDGIQLDPLLVNSVPHAGAPPVRALVPYRGKGPAGQGRSTNRPIDRRRLSTDCELIVCVAILHL